MYVMVWLWLKLYGIQILKMTNNDKNYRVQTSSYCVDLQLPISDHIYSNMKFSLVLEYVLECTHICTDTFIFPLKAQLNSSQYRLHR